MKHQACADAFHDADTNHLCYRQDGHSDEHRCGEMFDTGMCQVGWPAAKLKKGKP